MKPIYLAFLLCVLPAAARAQVVINQAALDQLAGIEPAVAMAPAAPTSRPRPVAKRHFVKAAPPAHVVAVVAKPAPAAAAVKPAPAPAPAPAVQPVVAKPAPLGPMGPVSIAFAPGSSDLPAGAATSLQPVCARAGADQVVSIDAYAAPDGADMSGPMRLSLDRAFAVRDALTACGVPAAHVIPRADGAVAGQGPDAAVVHLGLATPAAVSGVNK